MTDSYGNKRKEEEGWRSDEGRTLRREERILSVM